MKPHFVHARLQWNVITEHSLTPALVEPLLASSQNEMIAYLDDVSAREGPIAQPRAAESVSEGPRFEAGQNTDGFSSRCYARPCIHKRGVRHGIAASGEPQCKNPNQN